MCFSAKWSGGWYSDFFILPPTWQRPCLCSSPWLITSTSSYHCALEARVESCFLCTSNTVFVAFNVFEICNSRNALHYVFFLIPTLQMNIGYIGVKLFALNLTRIRLKVALYILMPQECRCHELGQNSEANVIKLYIKLL